MKIGLSRSLDPRGYKEADQWCGACLNAANEPSCPCLRRAPHPRRSQPQFDFVNSWPKSAFRCSQTIPISFSSWLVNTTRMASFVRNRWFSPVFIHLVVKLSSLKNIVQDKRPSISLLAQACNHVHLPFISQNSWCFFSTTPESP